MATMKLEHRRQEVASLSKFFLRLGSYGLFSLFLIAFSIGLGISGYHYLILTGMGPVAEMTTKSAKLFSSIYALYSGVAFLSITAVFLAPIIHRLLHILHVEKDDDAK
jgi:hypothetical protein